MTKSDILNACIEKITEQAFQDDEIVELLETIAIHYPHLLPEPDDEPFDFEGKPAREGHI